MKKKLLLLIIENIEVGKYQLIYILQKFQNLKSLNLLTFPFSPPQFFSSLQNDFNNKNIITHQADLATP